MTEFGFELTEGEDPWPIDLDGDVKIDAFASVTNPSPLRLVVDLEGGSECSVVFCDSSNPVGLTFTAADQMFDFVRKVSAGEWKAVPL
jgi:hypothetical protein